jgi:hypothetical protein
MRPLKQRPLRPVHALPPGAAGDAAAAGASAVTLLDYLYAVTLLICALAALGLVTIALLVIVGIAGWAA